MRSRWHKYKAERVKTDGYSFASKCEAALFQLLKLLEKANEVSQIQVQDHVYLTDARICMIPDFKVWCLKSNKFVWYEAKGFETPEYRIKRKLWKFYGPGPLKVFKCRGGTPVFFEEVVPQS